MRVVAVVITPPTYRASGGVRAAMALSRALARRIPYELAIMSHATSESMDSELLVRQYASSAPLADLWRLAPREVGTALTRSPQLERYLRDVRADLVHFHNPVPPLALLRCTSECRRRGIPYVMSSHGFYEMRHFAEARRCTGLQRVGAHFTVTRPFVRAVRGAAGVFILSPNEAGYVESWGIPAHRLRVVTNGVDAEYLQPAAQERVDDVSQRFALRKNACKFLFVGNHTANKGLDVLLRAARTLSVDSQFIIAGAIRSRIEHSRLLAETGASELGDRVIFTDFIADGDLRALYSACDAFVLPTRADTLPLVVLQAMACGLPVIASRVGGIPWQLADGAGLLVPADDVPATADAMRLIASDPALRARLGTAASARARAMFDWDAAAEAALAGYRSILGGASRPTSLARAHTRTA